MLRLGRALEMAFRFKGRGRRKPGVMNGLETKYSVELDRRVAAGEVAWWTYEGVTLKLAKSCRYTPDFMVMLPCGEIQFHETKGYMRDDALVKLKVAASLYPFSFWLCQHKNKATGWVVKEVLSA